MSSTPATAAAALTSMPTTRACACGEPSTRRYSAPGTAVSNVYGSVPVTTRLAAGGLTDRPTVGPSGAIAVAIAASPAGAEVLSPWLMACRILR